MRGGGAGQKEAGMLIDTTQQSTPYTSGYTMDTYRTSYAYGLSDRSGTYDIPTYFVQMNEQNGGMLYWPVTLHEKYSWYRYWARTDAYVGRSLELLSDLPMSKLTFSMPKMEGKEELKQEILDFYEYQCEVLGMFEHCQSILWEWNMIGNVYIFHEWDDEKKMWRRPAWRNIAETRRQYWCCSTVEKYASEPRSTWGWASGSPSNFWSATSSRTKKPRTRRSRREVTGKSS